MFGYYLYEKAFHHITESELLQNLEILNELIVELNQGQDYFYASDDFWSVHIASGKTISDCAFSPSIGQQFYRQVFPVIWGKMLHPAVSYNIDEFKTKCKEPICALWGVIFQNKTEYCLVTKKEVYDFRRIESKNYIVNNKTVENFKKIFDLLFTGIEFCESAFDYICDYSEGEIRQIMDRLIELDRFGQTWTTGAFSMVSLNQQTNLRASFESETTNSNSRLRKIRTFKLPSGNSEYFEPHLKLGNFRIHFFPEESSHTIYVGYIGKHLDLV